MTKEADAAFFEDWSPWASLDDLPPRPRNERGEWIRWGARSRQPYSRYYCGLRVNVGWMQMPAFEIAVPPSARIHDMVRAVPGACQHPQAHNYARPEWAAQSNVWYVPAEQWGHVRAALPPIKSAVKAWVASR